MVSEYSCPFALIAPKTSAKAKTTVPASENVERNMVCGLGRFVIMQNREFQLVGQTLYPRIVFSIRLFRTKLRWKTG